jgi:hypothetical protein
MQSSESVRRDGRRLTLVFEEDQIVVLGCPANSLWWLGSGAWDKRTGTCFEIDHLREPVYLDRLLHDDQLLDLVGGEAHGLEVTGHVLRTNRLDLGAPGSWLLLVCGQPLGEFRVDHGLWRLD